MCIFSNMSTQKVLFEQMVIFSPISGRFGIWNIFRIGSIRFHLQMYNSRKTNTSTHIFSSVFHSQNVNLLSNSQNTFSTEYRTTLIVAVCWIVLPRTSHFGRFHFLLNVKRTVHCIPKTKLINWRVFVRMFFTPR